MSDWTDGYVTEVDYTYGFYKDMAPAAMRYALLASGHESPPIDRFTYCELGFGQGAGLNLLAAANPQGDFWGTDFNPAHAAGAARMARDCGLDNLHVFDDDFEQFGLRDLPKFDYITLHGIWSWVSPEVTQQIVKFIDKHLKVGGVVYISYNVLPGWAHALPMRGLLSQYMEFQSSPADNMQARLDGALKLLDDLSGLTGSYFKGTPQLTEKIKSLRRQSGNYLAHEYLNRHWQPVFFSQMVESLNAAKLSFCAHANPLNCIDALNHTKELQAVLDRISNPIFKEVVRDIGINQSFRRDLFVRGPRRLSRTDHASGLMETSYVLAVDRAQCSLTLKTNVGEATLQPAVYEAILDHLAAHGPTNGMALVGIADPAQPNGVNRVLQALVVLVGAGYIQPCIQQDLQQAARASAARFNRLVTSRTTKGGDGELNYLATPLLGSGVSVPRLPQMFLQTLQTKPDADAQTIVANVWAALRAAGQGLVKDGQAIHDEQASLKEIADRLADWQKSQQSIARHLLLLA